ncbi:hypothetical protein ACFT30_06945 [Microbacterium ureisolvens]|uniref:hypothetical protein n=1 Tax=Microbacterium ureisolvens TaxID=2781186 RepID=UPI00362712ED
MDDNRTARSTGDHDAAAGSGDTTGEGVIPRLAPEDTNPASDLKTDVIKDVEREHTITGDFVGPRSDDIDDEDSDLGDPS